MRCFVLSLLSDHLTPSIKISSGPFRPRKVLVGGRSRDFLALYRFVLLVVALLFTHHPARSMWHVKHSMSLLPTLYIRMMKFQKRCAGVLSARVPQTSPHRYGIYEVTNQPATAIHWAGTMTASRSTNSNSHKPLLVSQGHI